MCNKFIETFVSAQNGAFCKKKFHELTQLLPILSTKTRQS